MYQVTEDYKSAIQAASRTFKCRVEIQDAVYTESDIISIDLDHGLATGDKFLPGGGFVNTLQNKNLRIVEGLQEDSK